MPKVPKTLSLQYLNEKLNDKVNFLPFDKRQRFLQSDTIILGVRGQASPNYLK